MTAGVRGTSTLAPVLAAVDAIRDRLGEAPVHGLAPGLLVKDPAGWTPASRYADGTALPGLISAAQRRWGAPPHVAAALAWKSYTYWVALPAVLGFAAGRVPDVSAGNVLIRPHPGPPFLEVGLGRPGFAPDAGGAQAEPGSGGAEHPQRIPADEPGYLRERLLDRHLAPVLDGLHERTQVGRRTLLGAVASGVAHALVRARREDLAGPILAALGVAHLVDVTPEAGVQRYTCCLAFTLPEPKVCRGCCLRPAR